MGFSVDIAALGGLPRQLDRLGEDAAAGQTYVQRHTQLDSGEGIINLVLGGHRQATRKVSEFFLALDAVAEGRSKGVQASLAQYRATDIAAAIALDAKLPAIADQRTDGYAHVNSLGFNDRGEPQNSMTAPPDYSDQYRFEMKWHSYLSPTSHVRHVIWQATALAAKLGILDRPIDIFIEWLKPLLGDWAGFRACADVHQNLASSTLTMSANVRGGSIDSQFVWKGNAASACRSDLVALSEALNYANTRLNELSAEYRSVAESTYKMAEAIVGLVVVAADIAGMALVSLIAASGNPAAAIATHVVTSAKRIWELIEIGMKIFDCLKIAEYGAKAFTSGLAGFNVIDPKGPLPQLAGGSTRAYSEPATGQGKVPAFT